MAPRTSWKGFIRLSLISVPVKAFTAHDTGGEIHLNQLHKECHSRVKYKKVCPEHGELQNDEIVNGYEHGKDQYVVIDPDELGKLRPQSDHAVTIDGFVAEDRIDPIFHAGRTYYLLPDGVAGSKPYALLRRGMVDQGVCAVAKVVLAGREQLVMLRPRDDMIVMTVLNVAKKIKSAEPYLEELTEQEMSGEELALTKTLIDASTIEEFDYATYEDEYVEKLGELIQLKIDGKEIVQAPDVEEPKIINLMDALKKSVAEAQAGKGKKMAASETAESARGKPSRKKKSG